jgi:hypothetical protein
MDVQVELFISAREGMAVYAQNPSYTYSEGVELLVSVKDEGMLVDPKVRRFTIMIGSTGACPMTMGLPGRTSQIFLRRILET